VNNIELRGLVDIADRWSVRIGVAVVVLMFWISGVMR